MHLTAQQHQLITLIIQKTIRYGWLPWMAQRILEEEGIHLSLETIQQELDFQLEQPVN